MRQNVSNGTDFNESFSNISTTKIVYLIVNRRFSELEDYLNQIILQFSPEWSKYAPKILSQALMRLQNVFEIEFEKIPNVDTFKLLFDSLDIVVNDKYSRSLLLTHNFSKDIYDILIDAVSQTNPYIFLNPDSTLKSNTWVLSKAGASIASGSIIPDEVINQESVLEDSTGLFSILLEEARTNLNALENFIHLNSDNQIAKQMYCTEATKFLPCEEIEEKMYVYTSGSHLPISLNTYSKIINKEKWSRLASRIIGEDLIKLKDTPVGFTANPWKNLSDWEDLDISRNNIDWYGFLKETEFWYRPMYYVQSYVMPEVVFIKLLRQAEKANDWKTVSDACKARFGRRVSGMNEWVLEAWNQADEKLHIH